MEKNNPSNPLWTPCKSFAIPRLSRSSESNLGHANLKPGSEGLTTSNLSFFVVHRAKHSRHTNDQAGYLRRRDGEGTEKERLSVFLLRLPPSFLASRGFAARRSHARALPLLKIWRKREAAQSLEEFMYWSIYLAWISDEYCGSFSPLSNWESEGVKTTGSNRLQFRLQSTPTSCQS